MAEQVTIKIGGEEIVLPLIMNFAGLERVTPAMQAIALADHYTPQIAAAIAFVSAALVETRPDLTVPVIKARLRISLIDGTDERQGLWDGVDRVIVASGFAKRPASAPGEVSPPETPAEADPANSTSNIS